ncbi:glycosyltransferase family 2 protein [Polynucleobacter paneuropaeus]|uniref:glycosyltransferase family 2 protein n=1 Tax=Polynucleobacter paneuropaeus TaxID=2527775 RepID=UPI0030B873ED|nr:glycosyltransferase [Polynucleobacter paneuropaeus]
MKISIITAVFNAKLTIEKTLNSISDQIGVEVEHIVIDGLSTDGTIQILDKYRDQLAVFVSERDSGIYDAMNKGLRLATGDIVGFLNADDFFAHSKVLINIVNQFSDPSIHAVFGDVEYFSADNPKKMIRRYRSSGFTPKKLEWGVIPAHPTLYLRRSVYDRFGLFNPKYRIAGDFEFFARIFKDNATPYLYLPEVMVRMQAGGLSNNGIKSILLINREIKKACMENAIPTNGLKLLLRYPRKLLEKIC